MGEVTRFLQDCFAMIRNVILRIGAWLVNLTVPERIGIGFAAYLLLQWVFFTVWNGWGYWVWVNGGSSSGSW